MTPHDRARAFAAAFPDRCGFGARFVEAVSASGDGTIYATWMTGNDYKNASKMYGAYPARYLDAVLSLFPDAQRILHLFSGSLTKEQVGDALNVTRGPVRNDPAPARPTQLRFDSGLHPAAKEAAPDVIGDAEELVKALTASKDPQARLPFDLIVADPPYAKNDQKRYWKESGLADCRHCGKLKAEHGMDYACGADRGTVYKPKQRFVPLNKKKVLGECAKVLVPGGWLVWLDTSIPGWSKREWIWRGAIGILRSTMHRVRVATLLERRAE